MKRSLVKICLRLFPVFPAMFFLAACCATALGQSAPKIVRVEEDWELVVGEPNPVNDAPQITSVISPFADVGSLYAAFEVNARSLPAFVPGGLQLQIWNGETVLSNRKFPSGAVLSHPGETVCWTQSIALSDGSLTFEITNGSSTTWGAFGGQGYLKAGVPTTLADLSAYDPNVSAQNSKIGFAENRVQSLVLKRVRKHTSTGEVIEDATRRVVHSRD